MKNKLFLKNKSAVFIGKTLMLDNCLKIASKKFKKISIISDDKKILKKYKKNFSIIKMKDLYNMSFDYLFSVLNEKIIPKEILENIKILGLNFHDGPLPKYAGLYSSTWAILKGEKKHGVCWHQINKDLDSGKIYQSAKFKINLSDSALDVDLRGVIIGIKLFSKLLTQLDQNKIKGKKQNLKKRTYYGKKDFHKVDNCGFLNFSKKSFDNLKLFRALSFSDQKKNYISLPKILTSKGPLIVKSLDIEKHVSNKEYEVGTILNFNSNKILVVCRDAILNIGVNYNKNNNFNKKILLIPSKKICNKFKNFGLHLNQKYIPSKIKNNKKLLKYTNSKKYENKLFEVFKIVKKVFKNKVNLPLNEKKKFLYIENLGLGIHSTWDSLEHIKFLFNIEKKFKIQINETNGNNFNNVASIARYLVKTQPS